jgi:hypothetical protein
VGSLGAPNAGYTDAFVAKYDAAGTLLWNRQLGTSDYDESRGVSADALGNLYISGEICGSPGGPNSGYSDAFVAKYDPAGTLLWTRQLGTSYQDESRGVSADALGNVYISGWTDASLGGPNAGAWDGWVARFHAPQVVVLAWGNDVPVQITELRNKFGQVVDYPVDLSQTMPAATTTAEFRQDVLQRVQQMFTDSGIQNVTVTDVAVPGAAMVYFTDPTAGALDGMAYDSGIPGVSIDRFNASVGGAVAVFLKHAGQADYGEYNAESVAHEVGHLLGLRHVDPGSAHDPGDLEVMDYDNNTGDRERFINAVTKTWDGDGITHNPVYHLRRYVDDTPHDDLVAAGIMPGTWDISKGSQGQKTKLDFGTFEKTLYDAYLFGGLGNEDTLPMLGHFDTITLSELCATEFSLPEGSLLKFAAASAPGGELDITLATGNPYDAENVFVQATIGEVLAYLQEWSDTAPGYITLGNVTLTSTIIPEPSTITMLSIAALGVLAYACRRRRR